MSPWPRGNPTDASGAFRSGPRAPTEAVTPFFQNSKLIRIFDGCVKSPSVLLGAGLRFNPAPLDKILWLRGIEGKILTSMGKSSRIQSNGVSRCRAPCKCASLLSFYAPGIWSFLRNHTKYNRWKSESQFVNRE